MAEVMVEKTKLNYVCLTKKEKIDKEQAKKNRKEHREKVEYDCYQHDHYHAMEIACEQAILIKESLVFCKVGKKYYDYRSIYKNNKQHLKIL